MFRVSFNIIKFSLTFKLSRKFSKTEGKNYIAYNNVPQGFSPYTSNKSSRVFIAVPRRNPGVPSTLNYIKLEEGQDSYVNPKLHSFPNYEMNELDVSRNVFLFALTKIGIATRPQGVLRSIRRNSMNAKIFFLISR
jgi:hypothetical protein